MPWHLLGSWLVRGPFLPVAGAGARHFEDRNSLKAPDTGIVFLFFWFFLVGGSVELAVVCRSEAERVCLVSFLTFAAGVDGTPARGRVFFSGSLKVSLRSSLAPCVFSL